MIFYVTLGVQYTPRNEHHPASPRLHPDGYLTVEADDEQAARLMIVQALGQQWAGIYTEFVGRRHYPFGLIGRIGKCRVCDHMHVLPPIEVGDGATSNNVCEWCGYAELHDFLLWKATLTEQISTGGTPSA